MNATSNNINSLQSFTNNLSCSTTGEPRGAQQAELAELTSLIRENHLVTTDQSPAILKEVVRSRLPIEICLLDDIKLDPSTGKYTLVVTARLIDETFSQQMRYNLTREQARTLIEVLKR